MHNDADTLTGSYENKLGQLQATLERKFGREVAILPGRPPKDAANIRAIADVFGREVIFFKPGAADSPALTITTVAVDNHTIFIREQTDQPKLAVLDRPVLALGRSSALLSTRFNLLIVHTLAKTIPNKHTL